MKALADELRLLALAWQFFTRIPLPPSWGARAGYTPERLQASARHFPLVGAAVGGFSAAVFALAAWLLPPMLAVGLAMAASLWMTGCFHEDGWADTCDALGGAVSREQALAIMKDSRIGTYGAAALVMMLGLKAASLVSLPVAWVPAALVLSHTVSRTVAVGLIRALPYAGDPQHAKAKPLATQLSRGGWVVAVGWAVLASVGVAAVVPATTVAAALLAAALAGLWCGRWLRSRLGGFTGDGLGAAQQLSELAIYLTLVAGSSWI
ncbi:MULTISPECIES: adenosylcobinamide-GDP ribazoletransferase [Caldimonas]|uniref:adenosylcobinamide-GDP ribazoletransferase n=1 Tax=Caldimonas TaxID=196013 RepID=UPI000368A6B8|nr:adenosylcobinamide-GDP ribazoletransferase [Caldimonas manganoxidans]GIX23666.1 MAG: adenosylcobinamide-GDP ribazoletransferase [Caldimonas sp.]